MACTTIIVIGFLNFASFVAVATYLGGDAINGKASKGHYYLFGVRFESGEKSIQKSMNVYSTTANGMPIVILLLGL